MKHEDYAKVKGIINNLKEIDMTLNVLKDSSEQSRFTSEKEKLALASASDSVVNAIKELLEIKLT